MARARDRCSPTGTASTAVGGSCFTTAPTSPATSRRIRTTRTSARVPLDEIAVMCGLELEPRNLAPQTKTRRAPQQQVVKRRARVERAPAAVYVGRSAALDYINGYGGSRSAGTGVEVILGAITVHPLATGAALRLGRTSGN